MLTTTPDRLSAALRELEPGSRALLDLSLRRGVSTSEIGELLRKDPVDVERGIEELLGLLAEDLGAQGPNGREAVREALAELPDDAWQAEQAPETGPPPAEQPEQYFPYYTPKERRPRAWPIVLLLVLLAGFVVAVALTIGGGDGDELASPDAPPRVEPGEPDEPGEPAEPDEPAQPAPQGQTVRLQPVHGGPGRGTVTLDPERERLDISIRGLPDLGNASYEIWVYNSLVDSQSLGSFSTRRVDLDARLPAALENYRYIDVSFEPANGNPNHSGESVLRAPVEDLQPG